MPQQTFALEHIDTPTGRMLIVTDDAHCLRALDWEDHGARKRELLPGHHVRNIRDWLVFYGYGTSCTNRRLLR